MRAFRYTLHIYDREKMLMGSILNTACGLIIQKNTTFLSILFGSCHFSDYFCKR